MFLPVKLQLLHHQQTPFLQDFNSKIETMHFATIIVALMASVALATHPGDAKRSLLQGLSLEKRQDCCEDPPGCGCTDVCLTRRQSTTL
jgi:hypothetical protein